MSKTVFTLTLPEARARKAPVPPGRAHRNKCLYSRKHKAKPRGERDFGQAPVRTGACRLNDPCFWGPAAVSRARRKRP